MDNNQSLFCYTVEQKIKWKKPKKSVQNKKSSGVSEESVLYVLQPFRAANAR
ncbi:MAG: hypothetical protein H6562_20395 [Lewinellaceae bacterium]|nr:hypothetical protein [Lewinella sp.]MCB9281258.1 hypothetical protein [Lewinellaceae bacterium]